MPIVEAEVSCAIHDSFRVEQVAGLFDVRLADKAAVRFSVEVPSATENWRIGLIVGPSGSGKTTIARQAFGSSLDRGADWPEGRAVVDSFDNLGIKQITGLLTAVGFSSPPAWIKPYHVLSGGERFRCDLARAMARGQAEAAANSGQGSLVVFDEFTSVVDRNVAQIGSAAISKALRAATIDCRFVAVSCHYDVADWLEPDWVVDMATGTCQWRRLRRPAIELELHRCRHRLWAMFAPHHYLSGRLSKSARCFVALWKSRPVAFCATVPIIGRRKHWRITRVVTLPDYQGVGIGTRVAEAVAGLHVDQGHRMNITASHPAVVAHCAKSRCWRLVRILKTGSRKASKFIPNYRNSMGRAVASFEFVQPESSA